MMTEIDATIAIERIAEILERVKQGEEFQITKEGKPVAVLLTPTDKRLEKSAESFREWRNLMRENPLGTLDEIKRWKEEGRR